VPSLDLNSEEEKKDEVKVESPDKTPDGKINVEMFDNANSLLTDRDSMLASSGKILAETVKNEAPTIEESKSEDSMASKQELEKEIATIKIQKQYVQERLESKAELDKALPARNAAIEAIA